jgi:hypothetical protein
MNVNNKLIRTWKETTFIFLHILSQYMVEGIKESHENPPLGWSVSGVRFERRTSTARSRSDNELQCDD